ncbi:MAG: zinc-dependent metalloprotease, partial [Myxococcales bacterium]|nr:zinc-dependent metalloprotease [Myxococcales bacterium]
MRMRALRFLSLSLLLALPVTACTDGGEKGGLVDKTPTDPNTETPVTPELPKAEPVTGTTTFEPAEAPPVLPPAPALAGGVTSGTSVTFDAAYLEDRWLFGIGADPNGLLAGLGSTGIGIAPTEARLVMEGGHLVARAYDADAGAVVPGDSAILMSFPATVADGQVTVDMKKPAVDLAIEIFNGCSYEASGYTLAGDPVFADGLFTWPVDETFSRVGSCPNWLPRNAQGLDVPYLRHQSASGNFAPRAVDANVPFGFFMSGGRQADELLDRLSGVDDGGADGRQTYYVTTNFPEVYVEAARAAFDSWNDVLEPITGIRPFRLERATPDMIAWDPRYHFVIWDETDSGGAMAPFGEDPSTGEVVQNLIIMWFGDIDSLVDSYTRFYDKHPDVAAHVLPPAPPTPEFQGRQAFFDRAGTKAAAAARREAAKRGALRARAFVKRPLNGEVVRRTWQQVGLDASREEIAQSIVTDFLVHEIGHHLGLRHNFKGSIDSDHTNDGDTSSSTMDYVVGMVGPGRYDIDAMRYAYGDGPEETDDLFCTDEDTELDPGCAPWDFGHPVTYWQGVLDALEA